MDGYQRLDTRQWTADDLARDSEAAAQWLRYADALRDRCRARYYATFAPPPPKPKPPKDGFRYMFKVNPLLVCSDSEMRERRQRDQEWETWQPVA